MLNITRIKKVDLAIAVTALLVLLPMLWQYIPVPICISMVMGSSMYPSIEPGSIALGISTLFVKPRAGDIVVARFGNHYIVHRLIYVNETIVITKGDANKAPDPPLALSDVKYVVVALIPPSIASYVLALSIFYILSASTYLAYRILNTGSDSKDTGGKNV